MSKTTSLNFNEFPFPENNQWEAKIINELKGKSIESISSNNIDNIKVFPFYTNKKSNPESLSYTIESQTEINSTFLLREKINISDLQSSHANIDVAINGGVKSILFTGDINGIKNEIKQLSDNNIQLSIQLESDANKIFDNVIPFLREANSSIFSIEFDPISYLITKGFWIESKENDFNTLTNILKKATENKEIYPKYIHINASVYHNTGASFVQELAFALAHANEYITFLIGEGFDLKTIFSSIHFSFSVGTDYFNEISKLRAIKILWTNLINSYDSNLINIPCYINTLTSFRYHSKQDEHTNILRTTTQAMSAIIGGCDTLHILPFNYLNKSDAHSKRIARNIANILTFEADFNNIHNFANGAYYIEYLTTEMAKKAWNLFVEIENSGGILEAIHSNKLQQDIINTREEEVQKFKTGKLILVGVNKYCSNNNVEKNEIKTAEPLKDSFIIQPLNDFLIETNL